jgi:WD40 repeat protein
MQPAHWPYVNPLAWSPDNTYIASGAEDRAIQVWEAKTGKTLVKYTPHAYNIDTSISSVAWSPDGTYIASNGYPDGSVQVWNAKTGATLVDFKGHSGYADTVAWSPDGRSIASGGADKTIQIWEAQNGHVQYTYRGQVVGSLAWSPDGTSIASVADDTTVVVWQAM